MGMHIHLGRKGKTGRHIHLGGERGRWEGTMAYTL